jgi:hypothetical protein
MSQNLQNNYPCWLITSTYASSLSFHPILPGTGFKLMKGFPVFGHIYEDDIMFIFPRSRNTVFLLDLPCDWSRGSGRRSWLIRYRYIWEEFGTFMHCQLSNGSSRKRKVGYKHFNSHYCVHIFRVERSHRTCDLAAF